MVEKTTAIQNFRKLLKTVGPGLLFASAAIGTSHLILSTRAGAHHGMVFFWVILGALLFKYPFFEFGPRYTNATGHSLLKAYKDQGNWAILLFMMVICINMFAVTAAVGAVAAGLLSTILGIEGIPIPWVMAGILAFTAGILVFGGYSLLDGIIKVISIVLLVSVLVAFIAVLLKGPLEPVEGFQASNIFKGAGLTLMISLFGWMPIGFEASAMQSIWIVEKENETGYHPTLKEGLFDFNLGYAFSAFLAIMFLTIGAFTVYGSGELLDGNAIQFSTNLIAVFTANLGPWSYLVIALAAFGTIYGTLITAFDAFARSFVRVLRIFLFNRLEANQKQEGFLVRAYRIVLPLIGLGAFLLFYYSAASMLKILEFATIIAFLNAPIIAVLNLRAIQSKEIPESHRPGRFLLLLAYAGIFLMLAFSVYYLSDLFT